MRVLCACLPGYGHLQPMVPLALTLRSSGHGVAFASERRFCDRVSAAGFHAFPAGLGPGKVYERALALPDAVGLDDPWRFGAQMFAGVAAPAKVAELVDAAERWAADLLVYDVTDFAGPVAAAYCGIPAVAHSLGPMFPVALYEFGAGLVAPVWDAWSLNPRPFGGMFGSAYVDISPPSLQSSDIGCLGVPAWPLRPVAFDAVGGETLPAWAGDLAACPTVYVTLGTIDNDVPGVIEAAVDGLGDGSWNVVVTVGPDRDPAELGPQPSNVHVERYVPQSLLLPHCDAVVCHGESGTMLAALALGLPLLLLPQGANQFWNAERRAAVGAGIRMLPGEVDAAGVRTAVQALLDDPRYRSRAAGVAEEIRSMPVAEELVGRIVALAHRGAGPRREGASDAW